MACMVIYGMYVSLVYESIYSIYMMSDDNKQNGKKKVNSYDPWHVCDSQ